MPRVAAAERQDLDPAGQAAFDEIAQSRGRVQGPFGVLLHSPELARRVAHLGAYVRYEAPMPARHRHLIALIASRAFDCDYEFTVHAGLAREEGVPPEAVAALGRGETPQGLGEPESTLVDFTRQLVTRHRVDKATFEALQNQLGLRGLTDVVGATAYFSMVSFPLNAFEVEVRAGQDPELPPIS